MTRAANLRDRRLGQGGAAVPRFALRSDSLIGWTESRDMLQQRRLDFAAKEHAAAFAERRDWQPIVLEAREGQVPPRNRVIASRPSRAIRWTFRRAKQRRCEKKKWHG